MCATSVIQSRRISEIYSLRWTFNADVSKNSIKDGKVSEAWDEKHRNERARAAFAEETAWTFESCTKFRSSLANTSVSSVSIVPARVFVTLNDIGPKLLDNYILCVPSKLLSRPKNICTARKKVRLSKGKAPCRTRYLFLNYSLSTFPAIPTVLISRISTFVQTELDYG